MTTTATLAGLGDRTLEQALEQNFSDGTLASAVGIVAGQFGDAVERSMLEEAATRLAQVPALLARIAALEVAETELAEFKASGAYQRFILERLQTNVDEAGRAVSDFRRAALTLKENDDGR